VVDPIVISTDYQEDDVNNLVWLEIKYDRPEKSGDTADKLEIKNVADESAPDANWLPDKIEREGNWFLFDTHFDKDSSIDAEGKRKTVQVLCCNLSRTGHSNSPTMLFHIDYWRKQITKVK